MLARAKPPAPGQVERLLKGLSDNGIEVLRLPLHAAVLLRFECLKHKMICYEPIALFVLPSVPLMREIAIVGTAEQALAALNRRHDVGKVHW